MRLKLRTILISLTMISIMLASAVLPQVSATTACPSTTTAGTFSISTADIGKYWVDMRDKPATGGYIGTNATSIMSSGLIVKTMNRTTFSPLKAATVTIKVNAIPPNTLLIVDDFLPAGFLFDLRIPFTVNGNTVTPHFLTSNSVRFLINNPPGSTVTIKFRVIAPKVAQSFFSQDLARVWYTRNGVAFAFDSTAVTVFVSGTGATFSNAFNFARGACYSPKAYPGYKCITDGT